MKTNGVPEKIYLQVCGDCMANDCDNCMFEDLEDDVTWCKDKIFDKDVEYTRTDAFIEKATKWLMDNIQDYTDDGMREHSFILVHDLKEHFKKYMKGE
jgi:hypothetical protein